MIEIKRVLDTLAKKRSIFHSEADLQHALAWEIHEMLPNASVRLEIPLKVGNVKQHVDIWVGDRSGTLALELKYKKRSLSIQIGDDQYNLVFQGAQDIGRYDFLKDIQRLEGLVAEKGNCSGYALLLTNDSTYWTETTDRNTVDSDFRIHEGRILGGILQWGPGASPGTKKNREEAIVLKNSYKVEWQDYSKPSTTAFGAFRLLVIRVS